MHDAYSLKNLQDLSSDSAYYQSQVPFTNIRATAVKEAAQSLGVQSGLYVESQKINAALNAHAGTLDEVFNFNLLLYHQNVLPPVIEQGNASLKIGAQSDTLNINGTTYNIIRQVRFVTAPPTWRDYLWMNYSKPQLPNKVLLPTTDAERAVWKATLAKSYEQGIEQGFTIYKINLARLVRDYNGMVLYKTLLARHMVSPFYVSGKELGVTGNKNHLVIDSRQLHIDNKPQLQIHSHIWKPIVVDAPPNVVSTPAPLPEPTQTKTLAPNQKIDTKPAPIVTAKPIDEKSKSAPVIEAKPVKEKSVAPAVSDTAPTTVKSMNSSDKKVPFYTWIGKPKAEKGG